MDANKPSDESCAQEVLSLESDSDDFVASPCDVGQVCRGLRKAKPRPKDGEDTSQTQKESVAQTNLKIVHHCATKKSGPMITMNMNGENTNRCLNHASSS